VGDQSHCLAINCYNWSEIEIIGQVILMKNIGHGTVRLPAIFPAVESAKKTAVLLPENQLFGKVSP
jgi:hypothetical protein